MDQELSAPEQDMFARLKERMAHDFGTGTGISRFRNFNLFCGSAASFLTPKLSAYHQGILNDQGAQIARDNLRLAGCDPDNILPVGLAHNAGGYAQFFAGLRQLARQNSRVTAGSRTKYLDEPPINASANPSLPDSAACATFCIPGERPEMPAIPAANITMSARRGAAEKLFARFGLSPLEVSQAVFSHEFSHALFALSGTREWAKGALQQAFGQDRKAAELAQSRAEELFCDTLAALRFEPGARPRAALAIAKARTFYSRSLFARLFGADYSVPEDDRMALSRALEYAKKPLPAQGLAKLSEACVQTAVRLGGLSTLEFDSPCPFSLGLEPAYLLHAQNKSKMPGA